ncbi:MAG: HpcH/HpaI aldolase/citrate lyase family protein [Synechococcales cyanobacterium]
MLARSYLYVPGDNSKFLIKAEDSSADALILDLEDSVKPDKKAVAEDLVRRFLMQTKRDQVQIRIEPTRLGALVDLVNHERISKIVLPKVASIKEIEEFNKINEFNKPLHILIESPQALERISAIAQAKNVQSLGIGELDFFSGISLAKEVHSDLKSAIRSKLVLTSAAYNLNPPVAPVSTNYKDSSTFSNESQEFLTWGYWGRACIHPAQVEIANEVFCISSELLSEAREVLELLNDSKQGATTDKEGKMIDLAHIRWAKRILGL